MVLGTEKGRRRRSFSTCWETGTGFYVRDSATGAPQLRTGQWLVALSIICLLSFAGVQQVSAAGGLISPQLQGDLQTLLNWKQLWVSNPAQNPNATILLSGWNASDNSPCAWAGIVCGTAPGPGAGTRVTEVNLASIGLTGPLPVDGYGNLSACTSLVFTFNQINGTIPTTIANMASLQVLDLGQNQLIGGIPPEFEGPFMNQLTIFRVSYNDLSVPIPPTLFSSCTFLQQLNLSNNNIPGNLPNVGNCKSLFLFDVWKNQFNSSIPPELGLLPSLQLVTLSENPIGGPIPSGLFANCGSLQSVQLARMALTGVIPSEVGNCVGLQVFNVQNNLLSGPIPPTLGNLAQLWCFAAGNNSISGVLPDELSALANLQYVDLGSNQITGAIPTSYSKLQSLVELEIHVNLLGGTFPTQLMSLTNLRLLDLSHNQFTGVIPPQVGQCTTMTSLLLAYNNFSGEVPVEVGSLLNLQLLDLSFNQISGSIPAQLGNLKSLVWLQLSNNMLTGSIPPDLGSCSSLVWLNLCQNGLTGPIPDTFGNIGQYALQTFISNKNNLPYIPAEMGECETLARWLPGNYEPFAFLIDELNAQARVCRVQWDLLITGQLHPAELNSPLAYMQLSYNQLSGPIPESIGHNGKFSVLFLDHNELIGPIPDTLNQIPLFNLNLSSNRINGSIPQSLGWSQHLLSLDLSFNDLTGPLPATLGGLTFMDKFNVSYNNLSGPVPTANQFATYSSTAYVGNPYLCSNGNPYASVTSADSSNNVLQQCGALNSPSSSAQGNSSSDELSPKKILGIALGCAAVVLLALGCICLCTSRRAKHPGSITQANAATNSRFKMVGRDRSARDLLKIPVSAFGTDALPKALAYMDLMVATNNFHDSNIIGSGGFGVVYKAKLSDGSVVAIKKLIQDGAQGEREFAAEMLTLGNIRHDNLVPLLGYCASEREKLLVYKCMSNGSLDEWLHDRPGGKEVLTWAKRVNIAAGAARGVAFLHHSCAPVIIHRDMKATNILCDERFNACVTDFGLARRMYGHETHVSTIVAGTLGYVPPEYSQTWRSTTKGDVYSFGVVLLELITGRRPTGVDFDDHNGGHLGGNVVEWVRILLAKRRHEECYDPVIKNQGASQELIQFLKLAVVCTEESPNNRPAMNDVSKALDQIQLSVSMRSPAQAFM
ncbi:unnamed protein product [Calypogeia fissa]